VSGTPDAPRVRFAPSPTGYFHVGGERTALYNWLFVRRLGGSFVLRIEDTDRERSDESWTRGILAALEWIGITYDEGPYFQAERRALYDAAAARLLAAGNLYACECTREEIDARTKNNPIPGYDGFCRSRGLEPGPGRALRFAVPDTGTTTVHDLVRGDVEFANESIEDFVVVKSNGDPLFVLAVVVDDADMAITHIIRAEEHLPTTPKAVLLWEALGAGPLPQFAHLPMLVNEKRQKLSKRRDRVAVEDYRAAGILPEAMRNYLVLLGWSPGEDREILSVEEMIAEFRLEDVSRSPAFFDEKRLAHFNGVYIRALSPLSFIERCAPFLDHAAAGWNCYDPEMFAALAPLAQERVAQLDEVPALVEFLFTEPLVYETAAFDKAIRNNEVAPALLKGAAESLGACEWDAESIKTALAELAESAELKLGRAQAPVRVATMGRSVGLPLFESLEALGRERTLDRLAAALETA
jgi:glutamyl-tRNA synthetase